MKILLLVVLFALTMLAVAGTTQAHEGEDHSEDKPATVSTSAQMIVRSLRTGQYEVMLKHQRVEPDMETSARLFVTRFASNEPVADARISISLTDNANASFEATASKEMPGMYELKLPPVPAGEYTLAAALTLNGRTEDVSFGVLRVAPTQAVSAASGSSWARTVLVILALLVGTALLGTMLYRATRRAGVKRETVGA